MHQHKCIVVGTLAVTCGSRVPILNDGLLVVVVHIRHRMDINRYRTRSVTGEPLPYAGNQFYRMLTAKTCAARLLPVDRVPRSTRDDASDAVVAHSLSAGNREALAIGDMMEIQS